MIAPIYAAIALALAAQGGHRLPRAATRPAQAAHRPAAAAKPGSALDRARAQLAQVKRDPSRRRYRHHWEKAIHALEKAAVGRDKAPALLEAARGRYALYRFSQIESDRDAALKLAVKAQRAGSRDAAAFAAAVRKEMGDDEPPSPSHRRSSPGALARSTAPATQAPVTPGTPPTSAPQDGARQPDAAKPASDAEPSSDPALENALGTADGAPEERAAQAGPATVSEVKSWSNADYTRVAIYLSRPVSFTQQELAADGEHPRRLALDLSPALLEHGFAHAVGDSLVARVRAAQRDPDTVRVVLDLAGRDDFSIFSLEDPPRLIVDVGVREAQREAVASARKSGEPAPPGAAPPPKADAGEGEGEVAKPRPIRRIIVDAGHGGHDTGASGPTRVREKDVTLAMAKKLAKQLSARGFEVVLTRKDDRYLALEERAAIANANRGDLFISLHANAHPRRDRRGIETYVLNVADDRYAARLAARENGTLRSDAETPDDVRRILSDLNALSSADASRRLAEVVQRQLCAGVRTHIGDVRDLGVKSALFYVLLGARMPAVLVETAFISNRIEEQRLKSPRFQEEAAAAIAQAVETFAQREQQLASAR